MDSAADDGSLEARREIADAIVTAAERGYELTLDELEAQGQPIGALGPDREAQAQVVAAWTSRATQRVAEIRATLPADKDVHDDTER